MLPNVWLIEVVEVKKTLYQVVGPNNHIDAQSAARRVHVLKEGEASGLSYQVTKLGEEVPPLRSIQYTPEHNH